MKHEEYDPASDDLSGITLTLKLAEPIRHGAEEYHELVLREPTAKQVRQADEMLRNGLTPASMDLRDIHLVAHVAGVPVAVVEQLPHSYMLRAQGFFERLLARGRPTSGEQ